MNLIALETATDLCSVALAQQDRVTVTLTLARPRAHAENLVLLIQDALRYGGLAPEAVDAVAVSMGPGSYTGLRIGVSTAKGLAVAVEAALIGIPSLEALAASGAGAAEAGDVLCAVFGARRDEVFAAAFRVAETGALVPVLDAAALTLDELAPWLRPAAPAPRRLWLVGDGSDRAAAALRREGALPAKQLDPALYAPSAASVARLALPRLAQGQAHDVSTFEPYYLKEFVAKKRKGTIFEKLPF